MYIDFRKATELGLRIELDENKGVNIDWAEYNNALFQHIRIALDTSETFAWLSSDEKEDMVGWLAQKASNALLLKTLERAA
jgi:hypothetical protein